MAKLPPSRVALSRVVDVADREDLFEILTNERVLALSQLGAGGGFPSAESIVKSTGVSQRRMLRMGVTPLDVAVTLAQTLQFEVGFDWDDCPAVALCHSHAEDGAAEQLAQELVDELGIRRATPVVINFGCVGFVELLRRGADLLRDCPEGTHLPLLTIETPEEWHDASDRAFCGIISSNATGATLSVGPGHRLRSVAVRNVPIPEDQREGEPLFWTEEGDYLQFCGGYSPRRVMRMNGETVFVNGVELMIDAARKAMACVSSTAARVLVVPHQPSGKMLRALFAVLRDEFPHAVYLNNLSRYANSISSSIPTVLAHLNDVLAEQQERPAGPGDVILLPAAGICMAHKGTHLSQGWAVLEW
jgi:3-oxoacyl-[acyl-carrier-protein] synthase III